MRVIHHIFFFFFSSRRRHTRFDCDWSSDVCSSDLIEPTERESKEELDRFCDALISIRQEIREVEDGTQPRGNNLLANAPHTLEDVIADTWDRPYARERAAFPAVWTRSHKVWPSVSR